jgi:glycosyltransferase involved in cell wall biosynthesis
MNFATLGGGERRTAALAAHLAKKHAVTLFVYAPVEPSLIRQVFGIDLGGVDIVSLMDKDHDAAILGLQADVFINNSQASLLANPARFGIYMCMFPIDFPIDLRSYQCVTANSRFTADWIKVKWGYDAEVVYSACEDFGSGSKKEKIILNVGRFFADVPGAHHKRQDVLSRAFRRMVDDGAWDWQLHLVGNVQDNPADLAFVDGLRKAAAGYPVRIRPSIPFEDLRGVFRRSSIYWHATGHGTDAAVEPAKQEHFGMAIVEAMSTGAVPLAFNSGGPRETIEHGRSGYLWNDEWELARLTRHLMEHPAERQAMSLAAVYRSQSFNVSAFLARMDAIVERFAGLNG